MTPARFRQVEEVFQAAADVPAGERAALLDRMCGGDAELRAEVGSLLASAQGATTQIQDAIGREAGRVADEAAPPAPRR